MTRGSVWRRWTALFDERDDPAQPHYDPAHLATVLVACQVAVGALFWLLWTLLVYEGGLPRKIGALITRVVDPTAEKHMLRDAGAFGGPGHANVYEGLGANLAALALAVVVIVALHRLDRRHARRAR